MTVGARETPTVADFTVTPPEAVVAVTVAVSVVADIVVEALLPEPVVPFENDQERVTPESVGCVVLVTPKETVEPATALVLEGVISIVGGGSVETVPESVSRYCPMLP